MKEVILYSNGFKPDKVFKEKMKRICGENAKETDIEVRFSSEMIEHVKSNLQKYYDHCSYYTGEDNTVTIKIINNQKSIKTSASAGVARRG